MYLANRNMRIIHIYNGKSVRKDDSNYDRLGTITNFGISGYRVYQNTVTAFGFQQSFKL